MHVSSVTSDPSAICFYNRQPLPWKCLFCQCNHSLFSTRSITMPFSNTLYSFTYGTVSNGTCLYEDWKVFESVSETWNVKEKKNMFSFLQCLAWCFPVLQSLSSCWRSAAGQPAQSSKAFIFTKWKSDIWENELLHFWWSLCGSDFFQPGINMHQGRRHRLRQQDAIICRQRAPQRQPQQHIHSE